MAAVVDDREDVWANADDNSDSTIKGEPPENLLLVRPYHWQPFVVFADINIAAGTDLSESKQGSNNNNTNNNKVNETVTQVVAPRMEAKRLLLLVPFLDV
ncbi:hypothetical protein IV203_025498 [Nitzschia inconspicua]|uniref:Uncharacterized protein n=1 Tax=Nitzschia inconspicua TaxID=303405 RepID=A0A9K3K9R8_9STRA|nr:hypothetical protein IV203_028275 [Nitzschia inconspicua]KAG7362614.1 hypothetical protein IV203_025498 [Nitzschia inconspicua]